MLVGTLLFCLFFPIEQSIYFIIIQLQLYHYKLWHKQDSLLFSIFYQSLLCELGDFLWKITPSWESAEVGTLKMRDILFIKKKTFPNVQMT